MLVTESPRLTQPQQRSFAEQLRRQQKQLGISYGKDNPMDMCLPSTTRETLGRDAIEITKAGLEDFNRETISTKKEITLTEAVENSFVFAQIFGRSGKSETGAVGSLSTGLPWDRQSPMEEAVEQLATRIVGKVAHAIPIPLGGDKVVVLFRTTDNAGELLHRFVQAPRGVYNEHFPHLADAVGQMQDIREAELLDQTSGNGRVFTETFTGNKDHLGRRAFQADGKYSFAFDYQLGKTIGQEEGLWGVNLDKNLQRLSTLAMEGDIPTATMLQIIELFFLHGQESTQEHRLALVKELGKLVQQGILEQETMFDLLNFFQEGVYGENQFALVIDYSATVSCCNTSFNAQRDERLWETEAERTFAEAATSAAESITGPQIQNESRITFPNGETYTPEDFCKQCKHHKEKCMCSKSDIN